MPKFCSQCGAPVGEGAKFCSGCGRELRAPVKGMASPTAAPTKTIEKASGIPVRTSRKKALSIVLAALFLIGVLAWFVGRTAYTSKSELSIDSLSANSAMPMALLAVTGSGFGNGTGLYVRYSDGSEYTIDVPAIDVTSNSLKAGVPPYINTLGKFAPGKVSVQVVRKSGKDILASNTITDFLIKDLPYSALPAGTVTIGYLKEAIDRARELQTEIKGTELDTPEMNVALSDFVFKADPFLARLQAVVRDPSTRVSLGSINGTEIKVGSEDLLNADRMILGMLHAQADGGTGAKGPPAGVLASSVSGIAFAQEESAGCQAEEAHSVADAAENGKDLGSALGYYGGAPAKSPNCKTSGAFNTGYLVVGGAAGVALGILALATIPAEAVALPTAAVLYLTIVGGAGIIAVGGALGKDTPGAVEKVKTGVKLVDDQLKSLATSTLSLMAGPIREVLERAGAIRDTLEGKKSLKEAFGPEQPPAGVQSNTSSAEIPVVTPGPTVVSQGKPTISLSTRALGFMADEGSNPDPQSFGVSNSGAPESYLNYTMFNTANTQLVVSPAAGILASGASKTHTVSINAAGLAAGSYIATIIVSDKSAANNPQKVLVRLKINSRSTPSPAPSPTPAPTGGFRSCIQNNLFGPHVTCSDYDGKLKPTIVNGRSVGTCNAVSNDGQCIRY